MMRTWYAEDGSTVEAGKVQGHTHCGSPSTGLTVSLITVGGQQYECSHKLAPTVGDYLIKGADGEFSLMHEEEFTAKFHEEPWQEEGTDWRDLTQADKDAHFEYVKTLQDGKESFERQVGVGGAAPQGESSSESSSTEPSANSGAGAKSLETGNTTSAASDQSAGLTGGFSEVEKPSGTE